MKQSVSKTAKFSSQDAFDSLSILDLMDTEGMTDQQRESIILDVSEASFLSFYSNRLPQLLTAQQLQEISEAVSENPNLDEVSARVMKYVPNFPNLLAEHTRLAKREFLRKHYQQMRHQAEQDFSEDLSQSVQQRIREQLSTYTIALGLLSDEDWVSLARLFQTKTQ